MPCILYVCRLENLWFLSLITVGSCSSSCFHASYNLFAEALIIWLPSHVVLQPWRFSWTSFCRSLPLLPWSFLIPCELRITGLIVSLVWKFLDHLWTLMKVQIVFLTWLNCHDRIFPFVSWRFYHGSLLMKVDEYVGLGQRKPGLLARYMKVIPCSTIEFSLWRF